MGHPIESLMMTTMESIKQMIDVNTIVGEAVESKDGTTIIPISRVSVGFASGGSDYEKKDIPATPITYPFGGGSGAGMSVSPVAFLIVNCDQVRLLPVNEGNSVERMIESIPMLVEDVFDMIKKSKKNQTDEPQNTSSGNGIQ